MRQFNLDRFKYKTKIENNDNYILSLTDDNDLDRVDKYGETILTAAIGNKNIRLVEYLVKRGVDINGNRKAKLYPLEIASLNGNLEVVQLLCKQSELKINREDDQSLIYSCLYNELDIIKILINKGYNVNQIIDGRTALHWAIQEHRLENVKLLIEQGAEINLLSFDEFDTIGETPLGIATGEYSRSMGSNKTKIADKCLEIIKYIINNGADINILDGEHSTILIMEVCWGQQKLVKQLLDFGADPNIVDNEGRTAFFYAKLTKNDTIAQLLIEYKANVKVKDIYGNTIEDLDDEIKRKEIYDEWYYPKEDKP